MSVLQKAVSERTLIGRLLSKQEAAVRRAFQTFLVDTRSNATLHQVRQLLELGRVDAALEIVDQHVVRMANVIPRIVTEAGNASIDDLGVRFGRQLTGGRVAAVFEPGNERAAEIMGRSRLAFIRDFTREQRAATRRALSATLRAGDGPRVATRRFRDSIGLTRHQLAVVDNYRALLERQSPEALNRSLRDRRFDRALGEAVEEGGEPLERAQIDRMVSRYQDRMLNLRAETIARTEAHRALGAARNESIRQMLEQTGIDPEYVQQVWNATQDARTRDTHFAMDGQRRPLGRPFRSPSGALLMYPGDPKAPPEESINCRCVLSTIILTDDELAAA